MVGWYALQLLARKYLVDLAPQRVGKLRTGTDRVGEQEPAVLDVVGQRLTFGRTPAEPAAAMGKEIGLSPAEVESLRVAGLLHDIGKIGVSDLILNKRGGLTSEEYQMVKEHPGIGATIVEEIRPLQAIVPLIYHHHERYDGSGYPNGLAGEDIPLGARVLAVADSFEAMTSSRAYRPNLGVECSLELLEEGANGQLDPWLVGVFKRLWVSGRLGGAACQEEQAWSDE